MPKFKVGDIIKGSTRYPEKEFTITQIVFKQEKIERNWGEQGVYQIAYLDNCYISICEGNYYFTVFCEESNFNLVTNLKDYPHSCPFCGKPAYINFYNQIDCSNKECQTK